MEARAPPLRRLLSIDRVSTSCMGREDLERMLALRPAPRPGVLSGLLRLTALSARGIARRVALQL